ncbi:MAG TPA: protein-L-isoaspartate O-methyltransferase [Alphaproteobacteria bacterium]|jgi:protein-L-isoaspartate(D-aspartate) O-methyltransferase|nr:protein-L-isoaspartate O-methyltransferase [Alphaproteobacteria bacterium]
MVDYAVARRNMVESQIRPNKVTDPLLLAAFLEIPREQFLPKAKRGVAYVDEDIELGDGRYLMEPMLLARLLQTAEVKPTDIALDIGCGTGYSTAILARLCNTVVAVESNRKLAAEAGAVLSRLGIDNAAVIEGPLERGYPKQAPYDVILFGGAVAEVPTPILDQLGEGGRLLAVIDDGSRVRKGTIMTRLGGVISGRPVFDAATPLLPGFDRKLGFVF